MTRTPWYSQWRDLFFDASFAWTLAFGVTACLAVGLIRGPQFAILVASSGVVGVIFHGTAWWFSMRARRDRRWSRFVLMSIVSSAVSMLLLVVLTVGVAHEYALILGLLGVWYSLPATAFVGVAFLAAGKRAYPAGRCRKCGYDLTGNESGVCPECGTKIKSA